MTVAGIRELKDNLSRYVREAGAGARIAVTANGRVVAELVPPSKSGGSVGPTRLDALVAAGVVEPATTAGDPLEGWPSFRLPRGTVKALIEADRGEA